MAWQNPKTDWVTNPKNPVAEDFNRIEGNIAFLKQEIEMKKGVIVSAINDMNQPAEITDSHDVLAQKIRNISKDATATVGDVLSGKTFYAGGVKQNGAMPNHGGIEITPGFDNIVIPAGYHDGTGYVEALDVDFEGPGNWASNQGWESVYAWGSAFGAASFSSGYVSIPYDSSAMSKCLEVEVKFSGRVRVTWHIDNGWDGSGTVYSQLYINDVAVGSIRTTSADSEDTYAQIVTVNSGDRLAIYGRSTRSRPLGDVTGFAITTYRNRVFAELKQGRY